MKTKTKAQRNREARYRSQLKVCRRRSWKSANARRGELIDKKIGGPSLTDAEMRELENLQELADRYVAWKTNDSLGRSMRRMTRMMNKMIEEAKRHEIKGARFAESIAEVAEALDNGSPHEKPELPSQGPGEGTAAPL